MHLLPFHANHCRAMDSTGIKFLGDGEWQARQRGIQGRRQSLLGRCQLNVAMDSATLDIRAVEFTPGNDGDIEPMSATGSGKPVRGPAVAARPDPHGEQIGPVMADKAHDTRRCHTAIHCPPAHVHLHERDRPTRHCDHSDPFLCPRHRQYCSRGQSAETQGAVMPRA